jgi:hypothetical protein
MDFMKMGLGFLVAIVFLVNSAYAQERAFTESHVGKIQEQVLLPFFQALKTGDVAVIKRHMSRDLYARNRVLLDENMQYPEFLRNYYKDITFRIMKAEEFLTDEGIVFYVSFDYENGDNSIHELLLSREKRGDQQNGVWVIEKF